MATLDQVLAGFGYTATIRGDVELDGYPLNKELVALCGPRQRGITYNWLITEYQRAPNSVISRLSAKRFIYV